MSESNSVEIQHCLNRLKLGDVAARDELVTASWERFTRLARRLLRDQPGVHRFEETDDVVQRGAIRLLHALKQHHPDTVLAYFRLCAVIFRRELLDLARHYFNPQGAGANQHSTDSQYQAAATPSLDPERLAQWTELHQAVEQLPPEEFEIFDLLWYHELTQPEAANLLNITERTVQRRWRSARLHLQKLLQTGTSDERNRPTG